MDPAAGPSKVPKAQEAKVDFSLSEEQQMMRDMVHDFSAKEIRPVAAKYDDLEEFPWDVYGKAHRLGLTHYWVPKEYGGPGMPDRITACLISEELSWGCAGIGICIISPALAGVAILGMGTDEQKKKYLSRFCKLEKPYLGAFCLTEPHAGSDVKAIRTTAMREGNEYVIKGSKCFITNGGIADLHVVIAQTNPEAGLAGLAGFVVEKDTPGLVAGKKDRKMGCRASHTAEVVFENVRVPLENRLGGEPEKGEGPGIFGAMHVLAVTRPGVAASSLGIARAAYEYALEYAKNRTAMGKPIVKHQAIAFKLAEMAMEIDAARLLIWRAAWMANEGIPFERGEGSMAKCFSSDVAMRVTTEAVQVLGGHGYMKDHPVEKWMRDAKVYQIWEGTSEIQRIVIARALRGEGFVM